MTTSIIMGVVSFIERMVFNRCFLVDYLGFYSLFRNIISVLSVADLGLSVAIAYSLYSPLAEDRWDEVNVIMHFLKKVYLIIGSFILIAGLLITPFLGYLVTTDIPLVAVRVYFIIYLLSTVFEYFLSYKSILLNADQKEYITTFITNISWTTLYIAQILVSIKTGNFMLYAICNLVFVTSRSLLIIRFVNRHYSFLRKKPKQRLSKESEKKIVTNVKGLISTRIGNAMVNSTDSILISALVGSSILGIYSNYQMVTTGLLTFTKILPNAISASLGNMGAVESTDDVAEGYKYIDMSFFIVYGIVSVVLLNILNPIVGTFFGQDRCLPFSSALIISILFFLNNSKSLFDTYKSSLGLYWYDRYRPIISGLANIIASIVLGKLMGFDGIMLATILTYVAIDLWVEPMIIFHRGFHKSSKKYISFAMARLLLIVLLMVTSHHMLSRLPGFGLFAIISRCIISFAFSALILTLLFRKNKYVVQSIKAVKRFIFKQESLP